MMRRVFILLLVLLLAVSLISCAQPAQTFSSVQQPPPSQEEIAELRERFPAPPFDFPTAPPDYGSGVAGDPWQLSTPEQLAWMADPDYPERLTAYYLLVNDITAPDNLVIAHTPIYVMEDDEARITAGFLGSFDGNNYTITVNIYLPDVFGVGLFGHIGVSGRVQNLTVYGRAEGRGLVGGLARVNNGEVIGSTANVDAIGHFYGVGGLIGINNNLVLDSTANGNVSGTRYVGGLIGDNYGTVQNSYATGNVSGVEMVGGLIGYNDRGEVVDSHATGNVNGQRDIGALIGLDEGTVQNSYGTGTVTIEEE